MGGTRGLCRVDIGCQCLQTVYEAELVCLDLEVDSKDLYADVEFL